MSSALSNKRENWAELTMQIDRTTSKEKVLAIGAGSKQACFLVLGGMDVGKIIPISADVVTIGRDPKCDLVLRDDGISRIHAEVTRSGLGYVLVRDLESTNGTYVGGKQVTEAELKDGEKVVLGRRTILKYVLQDELEQSYQRKMYESSTRDSLTGIFNRRYFVQKIVADLSFARRHKIPFSLLLLDIDHFKNVNDTHGHLVGDKVLVAVTQAITETIRTEDLLARYGGEEFAIIAQGTDLAGGRALAERIRQRVAETQVLASDDANSDVRVTVSLGVAAVPPGFATNPETLVSKADKNLYEAKETGRNRTVASELE
jgi:two-component system cell cycle response regulator